MDDIRRTSSFKHSKSLALLVAVLASNLLLISGRAVADPVPESDQLYARNTANQEFQATVNWANDQYFNMSVSVFPLSSTDCAQIYYQVYYAPQRDVLDESNVSSQKPWGRPVCSPEGQALAGPVHTNRTIVKLEVSIVSANSRATATVRCQPGGS